MNKVPLVMCIGEVLWDCFPDRRVLGGAPMNCAYILQSLGADAVMVSRTGTDSDGNEILSIMKQKNMSTNFIQADTGHPTGRVDIKLSQSGEPSYTIVENVAWDYIAWDRKFGSIIKKVDAICFGTLAQRNRQSRETISALVNKTENAVKVFDINLRQNFYSKQIISAGLKIADIVKLNNDELTQLKTMFPVELKNGIKSLMTRFEIDLVAVTKGGDGCTLYRGTESVDIPGKKVVVVDTVGSGDAFTGSLILSYLKNLPLKQIGIHANSIGAYVATQRGATPPIPKSYH